MIAYNDIKRSLPESWMGPRVLPLFSFQARNGKSRCVFVSFLIALITTGQPRFAFLCFRKVHRARSFFANSETERPLPLLTLTFARPSTTVLIT